MYPGDMRRVGLLASVCLLSACAGLHVPAETLAERNRDLLFVLSPGMTRMEVEDIMGTGESRGVRELPDEERLRVKSPYRELYVAEPSGTAVTVLYYYTEQLRADGYVSEEELTPVVFRDGTLLGWGENVVKEEVDEEAFEAAVAESILREMQEDNRVAKSVLDEDLEQRYREAIGKARMLIYITNIQWAF